MTTEHLLNAIGLLDDGLIQEAEEYKAVRTRPNYRRWGTLAACLALVLALGYALRGGIGMGGGSSMNGSAPAASQGASSAGSPDIEALPPSGEGNNSGEFPGAPEPDVQEPLAPGETDASADRPSNTENVPAIMVDGVLYWSTGRPVPGEVDESALQTVTSYINTVPEMDGQTNFSQDLTAQYAITGQGLVVRMDGEWILFEPAPPQGE